MATTAGRDLRERREAIVREHMGSENEHEFEVTLGTFDHPRYEIVPSGDVFDGEEAVRRYFEDSPTAFPDQRNELIALHRTDAGVIVEFDLKGHAPQTAARDPGNGRVYFDAATILSQLGLIQPAPSLEDR